MAKYPQIQGVRYDWASITIVANGSTIIGAKGISYNDKMEGQKVYGTGPEPIGRTRGKYEGDGSIELYRQEADELRAALGPGFLEVVFDVTVSYADDGQPTVTDTLKGVRLKGSGQDNSEGADALTTKFDLDILHIKWNDINPVKRSIY